MLSKRGEGGKRKFGRKGERAAPRRSIRTSNFTAGGGGGKLHTVRRKGVDGSQEEKRPSEKETKQKGVE